MRIMARNKIVYSLLLLLLSMVAYAQVGTNSPFSRYGYGMLNDNSPVIYKGMGGVGIGMRSNRAINPLQPASYTSIDSMTFMFDAAARVGWSRYRDASGVKNKGEGNLDYISLQLPIWKRHFGLSLGLLPFSSVGYDLTFADESIGQSAYKYTKRYSGEGGISQFYIGLAGNIANWVSLGFNFHYLFGDIENGRQLTFQDSKISGMTRGSLMQVRAWKFRFGAQVFHEFEKHAFTVGAIYEYQKPMNNTYIELSETFLDTISVVRDGMVLPQVWGIGLSYVWDKRLTIGIDFEVQEWEKARFMPGTPYEIQFNQMNRYALGLEYRHNMMGQNYAERMSWRAGVSYKRSYIQSLPMQEWKASIGIGLPLRTVGTQFNISVEYIHRGAINSLRENGLQVTFDAAIREMWFFKRKI